VRRFLLVAAALLALGVGLWSWRERAARAPAPAEEIDEASKQLLRDVLRQEDE
jgi:hypothetical protein